MVHDETSERDLALRRYRKMMQEGSFQPMTRGAFKLEFLEHQRADLLADLQDPLDLGYIISIQFEILVRRFHKPVKWTYAKLIRKFKLGNAQRLEICLVNTCRLLYWQPGTAAGGRPPYLSPYDAKKLEEKLAQEADQYNCMTQADTLSLMQELAQERARSAILLLNIAQCPRLCEKIPVDGGPPDTRTLHSIAARLNFRVCNPQELDDARRKGCDKEVITDFFNKFGSLFQRDERLIWNMDETILDSKKEFKVLAQKGKLPLKKAKERPPHLTGVCAFSAMGKVCKPMIILPPHEEIH
jgi:hypothetical protein